MRHLIILQHIAREGPSLFNEVAKQLGANTSIVKLYLGQKVPDINSNSCLLILGGPMGVNSQDFKNYFWLLEELEIIKKSIDLKIPMIGVCLGAQLIAFASGGNIVKLVEGSSSKEIIEIGWSPVYSSQTLTNINNFNRFFPMDVLHWHSDRIILPSHAQLIASSNLCKEQFFLFPNKVYGIQFHVELDSNDFVRWIKEDANFINLSSSFLSEHDLIAQNKYFMERSKISRLSFIRYILELVLN